MTDPITDIQYSNIIFESAPIGMAIANFDGTVLKVNAALCETIGYQSVELEGVNFTSFTHPEDIKKNLEQNKKVVTGQINKHRMIKRYISKSGETIHAIMTVTGLRNTQGDLTYLLAQIVDITDRIRIEDSYRRSEAEYKGLFESAPIAIAKMDIDGNLMAVNRGFRENFGYQKDEIPQLTMKDISHPHDLNKNLQLDRQLLSGQINEFTMEKRYIKKNGEIMHGLLKVSLVGSGSQKYFLGQIVDITSLKRTEKELERKNRSLIKINRELDHFVYRSSHDLKGPITTLKGLFQLAERENLAIPYSDRIWYSLTRLENVIGDLVNFSRNTQLAVQVEDIHLKPLLAGLIEEFTDTNSLIKVEIEGDLKIRSDQSRLKTVLRNLLSNAYNFSDPDKSAPYIRIILSADQNYGSISIQDNGIGIEPDILPKIFEMYYRGSEKANGAGLGLYVVQEILLKLHAEIAVHSQPQEGSTFRIKLPLQLDI